MRKAIESFNETLAVTAMGMTKTEAQKKNLCLFCKKLIAEHKDHSPLAYREYNISGIFGECLDAMSGRTRRI